MLSVQEGQGAERDGSGRKNMALTQKQETFCEEYVKCGNAAEAYRRAYSAGKMKPETVRKAASRLMAEGRVAARVRQMRSAAAHNAQLTLEGHLHALARLRDLAVEEGQLSAAISAEISRGKAAGLYTDRVRTELSGPGGAASEIVVRFVDSCESARAPDCPGAESGC